ncbi:hypothetical protein MTO96_046071 [Rhipicephalus appendiculatus]
MDISLQLAEDHSGTCGVAASMERTPTVPAKARCLHWGRPHSADSVDCHLWQRERRLATIKASAPTYLPHREAQAALRASPSGTGGPQLKQPTGKSYAAGVGVHPRW